MPGAGKRHSEWDLVMGWIVTRVGPKEPVG